MKFAIRADASYLIGTGHIMRCLTIAEELARNGNYVFFICANENGNLIKFIQDRGYTVRIIPPMNDPSEDAILSNCAITEEGGMVDWLIVDHYRLDYIWENQLKNVVKHIFVLDDLANRNHACDILLDQNYFQDMLQRYIGKVPEYCRLLLGPSFAILRKDFYGNRLTLRERNGDIHKILVFMGGSDITNETKKAIQGILNSNLKNVYVDIIIGASNPHWELLNNEFGYHSNIKFHKQTSEMSRFISEADLAVGAGGSSCWERCFLGLPTLTFIVAENQISTTEAVALFGAAMNLGWYEDITALDLSNQLNQLISAPEKLLDMGKRSLELMGDFEIHGIRSTINELYKISS
jgi:UDP-2,4-diacetamido-2,4,6-trideoxy-beta-L-altropyranose hydrolase